LAAFYEARCLIIAFTTARRSWRPCVHC